MADALSDLLSIKEIETEEFLKEALVIYKNESVSFYDSLIVADSLEKSYKLKTFDSKLDKFYKKYSN